MWKIQYEEAKTLPEIQCCGRTLLNSADVAGKPGDVVRGGTKPLDRVFRPCFLVAGKVPGEGNIVFAGRDGEEFSDSETKEFRKFEFREVECADVKVCVVLTGGIKSAFYADVTRCYTAQSRGGGIEIFVDWKACEDIVKRLNDVALKMCAAHPESGDEYIFADPKGKRVFIRPARLSC